MENSILQTFLPLTDLGCSCGLVARMVCTRK